MANRYIRNSARSQSLSHPGGWANDKDHSIEQCHGQGRGGQQYCEETVFHVKLGLLLHILSMRDIGCGFLERMKTVTIFNISYTSNNKTTNNILFFKKNLIYLYISIIIQKQ